MTGKPGDAPRGSSDRRMDSGLISVHLVASLFSMAILLAIILIGRNYADSVEEQYVHALAPEMFDQKNQGSAVQVHAFRQIDLLPVYGSSELLNPDPYHASVLFRQYPTGFTVFPVGTADTEPLNMVQKLAAIGSELKGKRIVISLSPSFYYEGQYHPETYAGNYSPLHANALVFSMDLSLKLKQGVARRMLDYPATLKKDGLLSFALSLLADGSPPSVALYGATMPLGKIHLLILNLQDHWETIDYISHRPGLKTEILRTPKTLDWQKLATQAEHSYRQHATNNSFGMDNDQYLYYREDILKGENSTTDDKFIRLVNNSKGWTDLGLLLGGLTEFGSDPLIIGLPINGGYFDYQGISYAARAVLYQKLRMSVKSDGFAVIVMDDHDEDKYFLMDPGAHLSSKGWVYYDKTLDSFYHGSLQ